MPEALFTTRITCSAKCARWCVQPTSWLWLSVRVEKDEWLNAASSVNVSEMANTFVFLSALEYVFSSVGFLVCYQWGVVVVWKASETNFCLKCILEYVSNSWGNEWNSVFLLGLGQMGFLRRAKHICLEQHLAFSEVYMLPSTAFWN